MKSKRSIVGTIILLAWVVVSIWPIWYFATIALRPRVEIIAPDPIYWPTFTTETWAKILDEWPMGRYFFNSIASVVGIPPTFIASMYGMNFHDMPELSWAWGYEWGLFLILLSTVVPIVWFKVRGWW